MNCPVCHAEMVLDYKIKIENGMLFNLVTIKKKNDQQKRHSVLPAVRSNCTLTFLPVKKNKHIQFPGMLKRCSPDRR